jgi:hypothetical protein
MTASPISRLGVAVLLAVVLAVLARARLVDVLTKTTGTWIGSPDANGDGGL